MTGVAKNLIDFLKRTALATALGAPAAAAGVFAFERPDAVFLLLSKVQSVEIGDFKVALGQDAFQINGDLAKDKSAIDQKMLVDLAAHLGPREVERLIHHIPLGAETIGDLDVSCDYRKADPKTRFYVVLDESLAEKGLVGIRQRDDLIDRKSHERFGPPSACYQAILTDRGADVKSLIVAEMTRYFGRALDVSGPAMEASQHAKPKDKVSRTPSGERERLASR